MVLTALGGRPEVGRKMIAASLLVLGLGASNAHARDADYRVRLVGISPPPIAVHATVPSDGAVLGMATSRPGDIPEVADAGWPGLVRNLRVTDGTGQAVETTAAGAKGWTLGHPVQGRLMLDYEVDYAPLAARGWPAP